MRGTTLYRTKRTKHEPNTNRTSKRTGHREPLFISVRVRQETNMISVRFAQCSVRFGSVRLGSVQRAHFDVSALMHLVFSIAISNIKKRWITTDFDELWSEIVN